MSKHTDLAAESIAYRVLRECAYSEELYVLMAMIDHTDPAQVDKLLQTLAALVNGGLLICRRGGRPYEGVSFEDLHAWILQRLAAAEALDEVPDIDLPGNAGPAAVDYSFETTPVGLRELREEDKPRTGSGPP